MDVSKQEELGGQELIQQLVDLTGLPADLVHRELDQILELSGQKSGNLTLDELRGAMLAYLEALQESYLAQDATSSTADC